MPFYAYDVVIDVVVVCIFTLMLFHVFHDAYCEREHNNLVCGLKLYLPPHKRKQSLCWQYSEECQWKENDGVSTFSSYGAEYCPK